jgi:hypothetical protein
MDAFYARRGGVKRAWRLHLAPGLLALGLLAACAGWLPLSSAPVVTVTSTALVRTAPAQVVGGVGETPCAYVWASQDLPDRSAALRAAFLEAGLSEVEARVAAYGETCAGEAPETHFLAMQTDFYMTVHTVQQDPAEMGLLAEKILEVLQRFAPDETPGPNPGYAGIRFQSPEGEVSLWFPLQRAEALLQEGKRGADLFHALENE